MTPGISYLGDHVLVAVQYRDGDDVYFAGPKFPITGFYTPYRAPYGVHLGWRRYLSRQALRAFISPEYQLLSYATFPTAAAHELFWSYGVEYAWGNRWSVLNSLGVGVAAEHFGGRMYVSMDGLVKLGLAYRF